MKRQCITCGKESENKKDFFELAGQVGERDICKACASEVGINNWFSAGFCNNTTVLKKYVKLHPEAQFRLDHQFKLLKQQRNEFKKEMSNFAKQATAEKLIKKSQTKCTCCSCSNVYFYGNNEVFKNMANLFHGSLYSINQLKDLDQCPKCGSRAIKKQAVFFWVDRNGNCVHVDE